MVLSIVLVLITATSVSAQMIPYSQEAYHTPSGWSVIAEVPTININHDCYYILGVNDVPDTAVITGLNIVFHDVYNSDTEPNWLNVYIFNEISNIGYSVYGDKSSLSRPDWSSFAINGTYYSATHLGTWSYDGTTMDVMFSTTDETLLAYLQGGNSFGIGIDPDCHFYGSGITVETSIPTPEPMTLMLLGSSLLGFAGFRKMLK